MDSITIRGYKSFRDVKVDLQPINILIGGNGSGKSNFLSVFELLGKAYDGSLNRFVARVGGVDKILHKGEDETKRISIIFREGTIAYGLDLIPYGLVTKIENERLGIYSDSNKWVFTSIGRNKEELELKGYQGDISVDPIKQYLSQIKKYHFHDISFQIGLKRASNIQKDTGYLYSSGENLAVVLYEIMKKDPKIYDNIVSNVCAVFPSFDDFYLVPDENGILSLEWTDSYSNVVYDSNDLSDGTIRFIALSVLFLQPNPPKIIVIDEPELGLHPAAIAALSEFIKYAGRKGSQIILTSQNPELISKFQPSDILTVDNIEGESRINRLENRPLERWLYDHTLGDLWTRRIIREGQP